MSNITKIICNQEEKPTDWYENGYEWITVDTLLGKVGGNESRLPYTS